MARFAWRVRGRLAASYARWFYDILSQQDDRRHGARYAVIVLSPAMTFRTWISVRGSRATTPVGSREDG